MNIQFCSLYPPSSEVEGGTLVSSCPSVCPYVRRSVCPSVCRQNCVRFVSYTILTGYISYLQIFYTTSWVVSCVNFVSQFEKMKFCRILKICNFDFVLFGLGIQYELASSMGSQGAAEVSSERRRSSCSSLMPRRVFLVKMNKVI